jgi:hypothetical protein
MLYFFTVQQANAVNRAVPLLLSSMLSSMLHLGSRLTPASLGYAEGVPRCELRQIMLLNDTIFNVRSKFLSSHWRAFTAIALKSTYHS